MLRQGIEQVEG